MRLLAILASLIFLASAASAHDYCSPCDLDASGTLTTADQAIAFRAFLKKRGETGFEPQVDYDGNGLINLKDLSVFLKFCAKEN